MDPSKSLDENVDDLNKIVKELQNVGEKISDENLALISLNSLPKSFKDVKSAIMYGRDDLTLSAVKSALK